MRYGFRALSLGRGHFWPYSQVSELWAHVDLNHGPHPYQGCALTGLSYGPIGQWPGSVIISLPFD